MFSVTVATPVHSGPDCAVGIATLEECVFCLTPAAVVVQNRGILPSFLPKQ